MATGSSLRPAFLALACCAGLVSAGRPSLAAPGLTAPAIDASIYRDGAVQRTERRFGSWMLTCDEIKVLGQKFCSMRGVARAPDGTIIASLLVSTDERGRPAAIVTLPFGTLLDSGAIVLDPRGGKSAKQLKLSPTLCAKQGCSVVWALTPGDIAILCRGTPLPVHFSMVRGDVDALLRTVAPPVTRVEGALPTDGFGVALQTSLQ